MMDAMRHLTEEERQTLADGTIGAGREAAARAHLRACPECAEDVGRLERLAMRARQLASDGQAGGRSADVDELWPGIQARIENAKVVALGAEPARVDRRASGRRIALAAGLVAAAWLGVRSRSEPGDRMADRAPDTAASVQFVDDSVRAYRDEAQALLDRLELTRSMLEPSAAAAIDKDLAVVDSAIAELQTAIARDPRNPALRRLLATSYREKIEVLQRVGNAG
jgi:anti-sigma factor ChrR (cupin superfamily)